MKNYPLITFHSTQLEERGEDEFLIRGELSMHGHSHQPLELRARMEGAETDPWGAQRVGLEARGSLRRGDYGLRFNQVVGSGNLLVGEEVQLLLNISAVLQEE